MGMASFIISGIIAMSVSRLLKNALHTTHEKADLAKHATIVFFLTYPEICSNLTT